MTREEAIKLIPYVRATYGTENFRRESYTASEWFKVVEEALTVEVVHCKECKYHGLENSGWIQCLAHNTIFPINGFCSRGERR